MFAIRRLVVIGVAAGLFAGTPLVAGAGIKRDPPGLWQQAPVQVPRSYALVIGISSYPNLRQELQLQYPEADAESIYTTLISPEGGRFPVENVHRLLGSAATLANIRRELEDWLPTVSKDEDRVLIYFAGHGTIWTDGKGYLLPHDVQMGDIPGTAYPMDRLGEVFGAKIKAKWRVLLTDACHSGAIFPAADPQALNERLKGVAPSIFSLTASRDRERSFEGKNWDGGHGVFTYYVIKGLDGEAANRDGVVTADELSEYVHENVRRDTQETQNPTSDHGGSWDPNMLLAYNPRVPVVTGPPPKFGTLVIEANMDNVEVFLDDKSQGIVSKGKPIQLNGITPGVHKVQGVHLGWEPYGPEEQTVYPGQATTVTVRITQIRQKKKAAIEFFDKGLSAYKDGNKSNYQAAVGFFQEALQVDPKYSRAALFLGRTYNALFDQQNADRYFEEAIRTDPDYMEARDSYAGALLDQGNFQTAIRQLNVSLQRDPTDGMAHYMMCVAFTRLGAADNDKYSYQQAVVEGRESVRLIPKVAEPHFWLAEALRMSRDWEGAETEYNRYLALSNFDSGFAGKVNYWALGLLIGRGKKTRPTLPDIWRDQRSLAYFGLCDSERLLNHFDMAIQYCQTALTYDREDPFIHYGLGISFLDKFNLGNNLGLLAAASKHFNTVIALNADTEEAAKSKQYLAKMNDALREAKLNRTRLN